MTGGQATLLLDKGTGEIAVQQVTARPVVREGLCLSVLRASVDELAEHERYLALLDKQSGGKTLWRKLGSPAG
jgi:DNA polymerase-3 subunit epsilon